jgi:hypothetical protein
MDHKIRNKTDVLCRLSSVFASRFIVLLSCTWVASAQDLKPISNSLAAQISASGRKTVAVVDFTDLKGNAGTVALRNIVIQKKSTGQFLIVTG